MDAHQEIAQSIVDGSFMTNWRLYALLILIPILTTLVTNFISERIKGGVSKDVYFTQENWKEKKRLYSEMIECIDRVFNAAWSVANDARTISAFPPKKHSSIKDGITHFPDQREAIEIQQKSMSRLIELCTSAEIFLSRDAIEATKEIRGAYIRATSVINMSYFERESNLAIAAGKSKQEFIDAARKDLKS